MLRNYIKFVACKYSLNNNKSFDLPIQAKIPSIRAHFFLILTQLKE